MSSSVRLTLALAALLPAVVLTTLVEGAPTRLPGVALGSDVLLHAERATAMFAVVVAVASVLREASRGRLPTQLSTAGLAYPSDDAGERAVQRLTVEVDDVRRQARILTELILGEGEAES